jgi:DNA-binding GntR family transcriptional regulator
MAKTSVSTRNANDTPDVAAWVRQRIRSGQIVPGQRLVEADIVRASGASRGKVREGLRRLESEGLIVIEPFRGASVRQLGRGEIEQIYRARMALEGLAAHDFALNGTADAKARLRAIQDELDAHEHEGNHDRFARLNDAWHRTIIDGSGNAYIAAFLARLTVPIYRLLFSTFYTAQRIALANADHRVITAAIVDGRPEDAERAMRAHITQGLDALIALNAHFDT